MLSSPVNTLELPARTDRVVLHIGQGALDRTPLIHIPSDLEGLLSRGFGLDRLQHGKKTLLDVLSRLIRAVDLLEQRGKLARARSRVGHLVLEDLRALGCPSPC